MSLTVVTEMMAKLGIAELIDNQVKSARCCRRSNNDNGVISSVTDIQMLVGCQSSAVVSSARIDFGGGVDFFNKIWIS